MRISSGYAHADATCKLSLGIASRVRRLILKEHWPAIPPGGDISDWIAAGHGREELAALIDGAPDYASGATTAETAQTATAQGGAATAVDDDAELTQLTRLPMIEYERARAGEAKRLGCRAAMLDRLVGMKRAELGLDGANGKQGRPIEFPEPERWPYEVDGAALLEALAAALAKHIVMSAHQAVAAALWVVHAYLIDRTMISPRLAIRSAVKGSGKTTCLDVLARLVPRPLLAANVSPAAIFRVIAAHAPTLLIDEADTLFGEHGDENLRGVLNAGHRQGGTVLRVVGEELEPRAFNCYAATVIALIGQLPGTLADRSIDIVLARRRPSESITAFRLDRTEHLDELARQIARWAKDNREQIGHDDPVLPAGLYNRAADNWRPLLTIAETVGGLWPEKARSAAAALAGAAIDEVSWTELLLSDIRDIFVGSNDDELIPSTPLVEIASAKLVERLIEIVPRPWAEYGKSGKPITQNKLARFLKPLGIDPERIGPERDRARGYRLTQFADAFDRYLAPVSPPSNRPTVQPPEKSNTYDGVATVQPENAWTVASSAKSFSHNELDGWTVGKGGPGEESALCAVCGRAGGEFCAWGDRTVWLHPECQRVYVNRGEGHAAPNEDGAPYTVLGPAPAGERCSVCGGGSPRRQGSSGAPRSRSGTRTAPPNTWRPWPIRLLRRRAGRDKAHQGPAARERRRLRAFFRHRPVAARPPVRPAFV